MSEREVNWGGLDLKIRNIYVGADKPYSTGTLLSGTEIEVLDGVTAGTAAASKALVLDANEELDWATSSSTVGNIEPLNFDTTLTGVGATGGRAKFTLTTNVALGSWSNALKGEVTYGAAGRTTGLGSAIVAEMHLSEGTSAGTYAPLEIELDLPANAVTGTATSLIYASVNGADATTFDDNGYFLNLAGVTAGSGDMWSASGSVVEAELTHGLKIKVAGADYYMLAVPAADFLD